MLKLHNSYSNNIEEFKADSEDVKIYLCGPTVQSSPHIGHGRSAVVFDFLIRYLKFIDYRVTFVYVKRIVQLRLIILKILKPQVCD